MVTVAAELPPPVLDGITSSLKVDPGVIVPDDEVKAPPLILYSGVPVPLMDIVAELLKPVGSMASLM